MILCVSSYQAPNLQSNLSDLSDKALLHDFGVAPNVPTVKLENIRSRETGTPFLELRRFSFTVDGGPEIAYDVVERRALDASILCAYFYAEGEIFVYLRQSVRPPLALRGSGRDPVETPVLWELPAGLIEPGETPHAAAVREGFEELGFRFGAMDPLGAPVFSAPAMIGEKQYFYAAEVIPADRVEPPGDGTALEAIANEVRAFSLSSLLHAISVGAIADSKTELGLRRFYECMCAKRAGQSRRLLEEAL